METIGRVQGRARSDVVSIFEMWSSCCEEPGLGRGEWAQGDRGDSWKGARAWSEATQEEPGEEGRLGCLLERGLMNGHGGGRRGHSVGIRSPRRPVANPVGIRLGRWHLSKQTPFPCPHTSPVLAHNQRWCLLETPHRQGPSCQMLNLPQKECEDNVPQPPSKTNEYRTAQGRRDSRSHSGERCCQHVDFGSGVSLSQKQSSSKLNPGRRQLGEASPTVIHVTQGRASVRTCGRRACDRRGGLSWRLPTRLGLGPHTSPVKRWGSEKLSDLFRITQPIK